MWSIAAISSFMSNITALITSYRASKWLAVSVAPFICFDMAIDRSVANKSTDETS